MFYLKRTDKKIFAGMIPVVFMFWCCAGKPKQTTLFNFDSLVSEQVSFLAAHHAKLHKRASINSINDDTVFSADTTVWKNELDIFRQLQVINKPVNGDNYVVEDGLFDPQSNLTVKAFSAKPEADLPVKYLRVFYQESLLKPRKIEALYDNKNPIYSSSRLLTLEFGHFKNKVVLTSYGIEGGQQMKMGDSVVFKIEGEIILD